MYLHTHLNRSKRPLCSIGIGKLGLQLLEHMQNDYSKADPDSLHFIALSSEAEDLKASAIAHQIHLETLPSQVRCHGEPKSWLAQTTLEELNKPFDNSVFSLILLDAADRSLHHDYARAIADLSRSHSLITIVILFGDSKECEVQSKELYPHSDLVLQMPNLNKKPWFSTVQFDSAYKEIQALMQICTKYEPATIPYDLADLRSMIKTDHKSEVLLKSIEGSLQDDTFIIQLKKEFGEGKYPLSKRFNKLFFHCMAGSALSIQWVFDHLSQFQTESEADYVICAIVEGENYFPHEIKLTLMAVI